MSHKIQKLEILINASRMEIQWQPYGWLVYSWLLLSAIILIINITSHDYYIYTINTSSTSMMIENLKTHKKQKVSKKVVVA